MINIPSDSYALLSLTNFQLLRAEFFPHFSSSANVGEVDLLFV